MIKFFSTNLLTSACLLLLVSLTACKHAARYQTQEKPVQRNVTMKAAIIYNFGGAQPVARENFHLLNRDAAQIWRERGLMDHDKFKARGLNLDDQQLFKLLFLADMLGVAEKKPSKFGEAIKPHIVKTATTDFEGNATFESVPEGDYYIYGVSETRSGYAVWSYRVSTEQDKTILLDNKNALYSW